MVGELNLALHCDRVCVSVHAQQDGTPKPPDSKKPKKPTVRYVDLPIVAVTPSLNKTQLDRAHEIEVTN